MTYFITSPLSQFKIQNYLSAINLTNFSSTSIIFIIGLYMFLQNPESKKLKNNIISSVVYNLTDNIYNVVVSGLGLKYQNYFSVIFTLFICVLGFNLSGLIPYSFTLSSHLIIALSFSVPVFIAMSGEAIKRHKGAFFSLFLPAGAPIVLIPLLTGIEAISYISRVFSLAIRLAANLIAGHVILKIIASSATSLLAKSSVLMGILSVVPLGVLAVFYVLEFAVAGLQAYVFAVLCTNYLNDALTIETAH